MSGNEVVPSSNIGLLMILTINMLVDSIFPSDTVTVIEMEPVGVVDVGDIV